MSIIFITHKLNEVLDIADRITVLRRGKLIETSPAAGATEERLARLMVGREVLLRVEKAERSRVSRCSLWRSSMSGRARYRESQRVSFEVKAGEIVGIAGVDGNGQTEFIDAITGLRKPDAGRRSIAGSTSRGESQAQHFDNGVGHIPEDRQQRGLVLDFSIAENIALHDFRKSPDVSLRMALPKPFIERARRLIKEFDVRGGGRRHMRAHFSGGNQQKVILAREIDRDPTVLIAAQPTRGLDVGAIEFVHRRLVEERDEGRGVLLVSLELDEVLSLADRILVIYEGEIVGEFPPTATEEELGLAMTAAGGRESRDRMSEGVHQLPEGPDPEIESVVERYWLLQKAGGLVAPLLTVVLAFFISGLVVLVTTGSVGDTLQTYKAIFEGTGLSWFFEVGNYDIGLPFTDATVWFPWNTNEFESLAAANLQQTLILWVALVLTGLAVAFAFRCGLFNIGAQGQYLAGSIVAVLVATELPKAVDLPGWLLDHRHGARRHAGRRNDRRDRRAPEGHSRRARGDHDDHAQLDRPVGGVVLLRHRRTLPD